MEFVGDTLGCRVSSSPVGPEVVCTVGDQVSPRVGALDGDLLVGFVVVGTSVGEKDSLGVVGPIVGVFVDVVGDIVGCLEVKVGDFVGFSVGLVIVGALVGDVVVFVGLVLGASVSPSAVGAALGERVLLVGAIVGAVLSTIVGDFVGLRVL